MNSDTPFDWGEHAVEPGIETRLQLGPLELAFTQESGEIRLLFNDPPWSRFVASDWNGRIRLSPLLPDRLVVVKPENEFWLLSGARARIYVRVPLMVRVEALGTRPRSLVDIPTEAMSDTWWGTPEEGELAYWLDTRARQDVQPGEFEEHLCICPLQLENSSLEELTVDRIALRVDYLSVYRDGTRLWSDETRVHFLGTDVESRIEMAGRPPAEAPEATRVTGPRLAMSRGFTARTFARIRSSLGGWL
jgi:hypothetical protein